MTSDERKTQRRFARHSSFVTAFWSGRRESNPRPTAWKAVTLPLSYSRLRARSLRLLALRRAGPLVRRCDLLRSSARSRLRHPQISLRRLAIRCSLRTFRQRAKDGGEGRTRTFEAARATDLQSAAFDRFATSPTICVWNSRVLLGAYLTYADGAGEGI